MKHMKILFIVLICFTFFITAILFAISYIKVHSLIEIADPDYFVTTFNSADYTPVELNKCTDWDDPMYGWCVKSEYFPYKKLTLRNVIKNEGTHLVTKNGNTENLTKPYAWVLTDTFWNIFYIFYSDGDSLHRAGYYGPFKL